MIFIMCVILDICLFVGMTEKERDVYTLAKRKEKMELKRRDREREKERGGE